MSDEGKWLVNVLKQMEKLRPDSPMVEALKVEVNEELPYTATYWYYRSEKDWWKRTHTLEEMIESFVDFEDMYPGTITNQLTGEKWEYKGCREGWVLIEKKGE